MLIIIMEATRGQQIVEAVIKVVVGATKEDNIRYRSLMKYMDNKREEI